MIKYYVFSDCSGICSEFYDTKEEAQADIDNDITCWWGTEAEIIECNVND